MFDGSEEIIYGACDAGVTAWSLSDGKKLFSFASEYPVEAIAQTPDGTVMATVNANVSGGHTKEPGHQIQLWQLDSSEPKLIKALDGHDNDIVQLKFTADGERLVSSSYDGQIKVWNWQQGTLDRKTSNLYSNNGVFSLSANSQLIAGNFHSSTMINLVTGLPLRNTFKPRQKQLSVMAFNPQNQLFARVENSPDSNSLIDLWSTDNFLAELSSIRDSYRTIPISKYWINQEQQHIAQESEAEINKPVSIGVDPQAIAQSAIGLSETSESEQEQVQLEYPEANLARVTITQTNLTDDSVADIRYLVEFAPYGDAAAEQWQIIWAGEQFKCQSGRGHQNWGTDLCH